MSIEKIIEVNPKAMEIIDELHKTIEEEHEIDSKMANRIEKYIEYENKKWIMNHKDEEFIINGHETTALDYLVVRKMLETVKVVDLDNEDNFEGLSNAIRSYYNSITNDNVTSLNNSILINVKGETRKFNLCNNLENYIINCDNEYAEKLDDQVDWFYENYVDYEQRKEEREAEEEIVEETRSINTLSEWVSELSNYIVVDKKLKLRK